MTNPKIGTLCDHFDQGSINTYLWTTPTYVPDTSDSLSMASVGTSAVATTLVQSPVPTYGGLSFSASVNLPTVVVRDDTGIQSVIPYDLTNSGLSVEFASYTNDSSFITGFQLADSSHHYLRWRTSSATQIYCEDSVNSQIASFEPPTYTSTAFRYLRIREASGTVYFDYSPDGVNWTNGVSESDPFDCTALYVSLYGDYSGSNSGTVGTASWANVNYVL